MNKYIIEFIGTFFLVLTIGCTVLPGAAGVIAPLAIGSALMALVYAGGHISGAHYNPAVTLAVFLRGKCSAKDVGPYIAAQVIGAVLGALAAGYLFPTFLDAVAAKASTAAAIDLPRVMLAELLFTFALVFVVLNVATAKANAGNSHYGLAIGFIVMAGAFSVGSIKSGVFNPAVAIGACVMKLVSFSDIWVYFIAQFAAAILAAIVFKFTNPADAA